MRLTFLAAVAAFSLMAADTPPKPKVEAPAPTIVTSKFWRLVAAAQQARMQANQTPQAKAADAADLEVQKEQERLAGLCGASHVLGYQQDPKAENAGDIVCIAKPPTPTTPPPTAENTAAKKEK